MIIVFILVGLILGYLIAFVMQRKKTPLPLPPKHPQHDIVPPQSPSYLEDKMWYEGQLDFLFKFSEKLISALNLQNIVQHITETAYNFLPVERTAFLTWDKNTAKFSLACAVGLNYDYRAKPLEIGKDSIAGHVMRNREALVVQDLEQDFYLSKLNKEEFLQKAFICAPLIFKNEFLGVLYVCDKKTPGPFTQREVSVVMNIVRMGAISMENARLLEQLSKRAKELEAAYQSLKEMQDKLIQSEKLKAIGLLASGVAHEMRNPIGTIMQGVTFLEQIIPLETKEVTETLSIVKESIQRADRIVISLLDFSRATKLEFSWEDINAVLENSLNLVKTELKSIEVVKEIQKNLPKVSVDMNKLMQVFINLFMNAIHAMPQGGRLIIRVFVKQLREAINSVDGQLNNSFAAGEKVLMVEIEDTGAGISAENLRRIFDPFFTTKGQGKGTGLGLSICRNIIMMHKGTIDVQSQALQGTKVIIYLRIPDREEGNNG